MMQHLTRKFWQYKINISKPVSSGQKDTGLLWIISPVSSDQRGTCIEEVQGNFPIRFFKDISWTETVTDIRYTAAKYETIKVFDMI